MANDPKLAVNDAKPPQAARNVLDYLTSKIGEPTGKTFVLALTAGGYIAFGSIAYLVTGAGGGELFSGTKALAAGIAFSVGLILVIVAGAELFTGDTLMVVKRVRGTLDRGTMWRFWGLVYFGNFLGAIAIAILFVIAGGHMGGDGAVGANALKVAAGKTGKGVLALIASGILANMLVCLGVWVAQAARTIPGKILALTAPIAAFVTAGFEHSVANMSILPIGLFVQGFAGPEFWASTGMIGYEGSIGLWGAIVNLVFVTLGNIVGGGVIGLSYWYAYLRED